MKAVPKIPTAAKGTADVIQAGIAYLNFSGADTKQLSSAATQSLKL